jgi:hypothetical protein
MPTNRRVVRRRRAAAFDEQCAQFLLIGEVLLAYSGYHIGGPPNGRGALYDLDRARRDWERHGAPLLAWWRDRSGTLEPPFRVGTSFGSDRFHELRMLGEERHDCFTSGDWPRVPAAEVVARLTWAERQFGPPPSVPGQQGQHDQA